MTYLAPTSHPTISEIVTATTTGEISCHEHVGSRLDRIHALEPDVRAWAHLDPAAVLETADVLDTTRRDGPLLGVTVGIKDIIDTHDMPTEYGSDIYRGHRPARDAACVALTRRAGGVVLGKTVTTEFANVTPGKTRNPFDPSRTPGGSSSGSAAAVAAGMVDVAIGTQTTGSTIRPASFCGVVGYRPSFGDMTTSGVMEVSGSVDTLGILARHVDDIAVCRDVMMGVPPQPLPPVPTPRVGLCRTEHWLDLASSTRSLIEDAAERLAANSAVVEEVASPAGLGGLEEAHRWITGFEMARNLTWEIDNHWESLSAGLREGRLRDGAACSEELYEEMKSRACRARHDSASMFEGVDALLIPAAAGEATSIQDPVPHPWAYQAWTVLHAPTISLPVSKGPTGLPVGIQLVGRLGSDRRLLGVARWVEERLGYPTSYGPGS